MFIEILKNVMLDFSNLHKKENSANTNAHCVLCCGFSGVSTGLQQHSNVAVGGNTSKASLSQVQTLALNGLNMLSQSQTQDSSSTKDKR